MAVTTLHYHNHQHFPSPERLSPSPAETLYPLNTETLPPPPSSFPPATLGKQHPDLGLRELDYSRLHMEVKPYSIGPLVADLFGLAGCQDLSVVASQ